MSDQTTVQPERPDDSGRYSSRTMAGAFVLGVLLGAGAALVLAPDRGAVTRQRLIKGARIAGEEFAGAAAETREAFEALGKDARRTFKRTASRIGSVFQATKEALTTDVDNSANHS